MAEFPIVRQLLHPIPVEAVEDNSILEMTQRSAGFHICKEITITGTGTIVANALELTGSVEMLNAFVEITEVTTLTNCTNVYYYLYDGTNSVDITADGATLSGAPVGTILVKDQDSSFPLTVAMSDTCRVTEPPAGNKFSHYPYVITAKNGASTYIRFSLTTTDNPVNFKVGVHIEYRPVDGGTLEFL